MYLSVLTDMHSVYTCTCYIMLVTDNRIERLEFLDEKELLTQLFQHYCVSCGYNDKRRIGEFVDHDV